MLEDLQAFSGRERKHPTDEGQVHTVFAVGWLIPKGVSRFMVGTWQIIFWHIALQRLTSAAFLKKWNGSWTFPLPRG